MEKVQRLSREGVGSSTAEMGDILLGKAKDEDIVCSCTKCTSGAGNAAG